jgi:hypothetical protein
MSGVTDEALSVKFINDAEVLIDAYVGKHVRFIAHDLTGKPSAVVASGSTTLPSTTFGDRRPNYWAKGGVYVHLLNESGAGQKRQIIASTTDSVTLLTGFTVALSETTEFMVHQESKFPRFVDQDPFGSPRLPDVLEQAVAFQVEYGIHFGSEEYGLGDTAVSTNEEADVQSRTYGSGYSETRIPTLNHGMARFIAPKTKAILRDLLKVTGRL